MLLLFKRYIPYALVLLLALLYALLLLQGTNLITADLGRHLMNGKLFLESWQPIATNTYSYTYPEFPVLNHHWLSGVLFYLVFLVGGFKATHLLFIAVSLTAFVLFFRVAQKNAGMFLASMCALLFMPLIAERIEVRPEAFSYLFAGLFLLLLYKHREGTLPSKKLTIILTLTQIVWVNMHIYFFLGWVFTGVFLFESILASGFRSRTTKTLALCCTAACAVSLVNPFLLEGALAPFTIFHEYGYRLVENQSVWFLQKIMNRPNLVFFEVALALLIISFIPVFLKKHRGLNTTSNLVFALGFSAAGALALRNFTLFALVAFPIFAHNIALVAPGAMRASRKLILGSAGVPLLLLLLTISGEMRTFYAYPSFNLGLLPGNEHSAEFFLNNNLRGPVFNNYDIGGYLIHYLYPQEKVFVDNRPEAYPAEFFQKIYIPMQEDENVWKKQDERYGFNSIFFSHRDFTPWGQAFLGARIEDPTWAIVYVDQFAIIFLKRIDANRKTIEAFEIAKENFRVRKN